VTTSPDYTNCLPAAPVSPGSIGGRILGTADVYLGRVGFDINLGCASRWDMDGDQVTLTLHLNEDADIDTALILRDQLINLADNIDEPVIPVVWGAEPTRNGFYSINSVRVIGEGPWLGVAQFDCEITMTRMQDYRAPLLIAQKYGTRRDNVAGDVTAADNTWRHSLPLYVDGYTPALQVGTWRSASVEDYTSVIEAVPMVMRQTGHPPDANEHSYRIVPDQYYTGAATILTGTALPTAHGVDPASFINSYHIVTGQNWRILPRRWVLSNGLIRIWPDPTNEQFHIQVYVSGSGWEGGDNVTTVGPKSFKFESGVTTAFILGAHSGNATDWASASIIRNSPEEVAIRLLAAYDETGTPNASRDEPHTVDIYLRRGYRSVSFHLFDSVGGSVSYDLNTSPNASESGWTAVAGGGGFRRTSNDLSGNQIVVATSRTRTSPSNSEVRGAGAGNGYVDFGVGISVGGSGSVAPDTPDDICMEHYDASPEFTAFGRA